MGSLLAELKRRHIYRVAAEREIQLRRLNYRRDSLEDIFLKAVEQVARPVSAGEPNGHL